MKEIPVVDTPHGEGVVGTLSVTDGFHNQLIAMMTDKTGTIIQWGGFELGFEIYGTQGNYEIKAVYIGNAPAIPSKPETTGTISIAAEEIAIPYPNVTFTFTGSEATMEKEMFVDEVFDKIIEAVSLMFFGEKDAQNISYKNLIRISLEDKGVYTKLVRLHDDAEIRDGKKT